MPLKHRRPSTCHPPKPAVTKAGLCSGCYARSKRTGQKVITDLQETIASTKRTAEQVKADAQLVIDRSTQTLDELVAEAERTLQESLPDAARWMRTAAEKAALKGFSGPSETILREVSVPARDGKGTRRLLEPPARQYQHGTDAPTGPQIIVGVSIGQLGAQAPSQGAEPVQIQAGVQLLPASNEG